MKKGGITRDGITRDSEGWGRGRPMNEFMGDRPGQQSEPKYDRVGKCQFCHNRNYPECIKNCKDMLKKLPGLK